MTDRPAHFAPLDERDAIYLVDLLYKTPGGHGHLTDWARDAVATAKGEDVAWFINEDGGVYPYSTRGQAEAFPDDDHTPYPSQEAAQRVSDQRERAIAVRAGDIEEHLYEKCRDCHLFVEPNSGYRPGLNIAQWSHLARGNAFDERLDADHEPFPSGMKANLNTWRVFGPVLMRERFVTPDEWANA